VDRAVVDPVLEDTGGDGAGRSTGRSRGNNGASSIMNQLLKDPSPFVAMRLAATCLGVSVGAQVV
jgi:hypothetical protein